MCVYSTVLDTWTDKIPVVGPYIPYVPWSPLVDDDPVTKIHIDRLLKDFKEQVAKAKQQDVADGNPDCEDPEKAKLEERVKELEKLLAKAPEFVIVKRQNLQPGLYRVVGGELHRAIE